MSTTVDDGSGGLGGGSATPPGIGINDVTGRLEYIPPEIVMDLVGRPRYGHHSNFSVMFSEDGAAKKDYMSGLIFAGAFAFAVFMLWCICLIVWMFLGYKRVGFLSGHFFVGPRPKPKPIYNPHDVEDENDPNYNAMNSNSNMDGMSNNNNSNSMMRGSSHHNNISNASSGNTQSFAGDTDSMPGNSESFHDESNHSDVNKRNGVISPEQAPVLDDIHKQKQKELEDRQQDEELRAHKRWLMRNFILRIIFLLSAVMFITFAALLVTKGIANLNQTVITVHNSAGYIATIATELSLVVQQGLTSIQSFTQAVSGMISNEIGADDEFCPANPDLSSTATGQQLREIADDAKALLDELGVVLERNNTEILEFAWELQRGMTSLEAKTGINLNDWKIMLIMIPYMLFPCFLMVGVIVAMFDVSIPYYTTTIHWIFMPIFICLTVIAMLISCGMVIMAGMNADFCLPGGTVGEQYERNNPDVSIQEIMDTIGYNDTTLVGQAVEWYVSQCDAQRALDPFERVSAYTPTLEVNQQSLEALDETLKDHNIIAELSLYCARDYTSLQTSMDMLQSLIKTMVFAVERILDLTSCQNLALLYTDTIYQGTCTYSVNAMYWIYICAMVMAFFGLVMITLRSSYKLTYDPYRHLRGGKPKNGELDEFDPEQHDPNNMEAFTDMDGDLPYDENHLGYRPGDEDDEYPGDEIPEDMQNLRGSNQYGETGNYGVSDHYVREVDMQHDEEEDEDEYDDHDGDYNDDDGYDDKGDDQQSYDSEEDEARERDEDEMSSVYLDDESNTENSGRAPRSRGMDPPPDAPSVTDEDDYSESGSSDDDSDDVDDSIEDDDDDSSEEESSDEDDETTLDDDSDEDSEEDSDEDDSSDESSEY